MNIVLGNTNKCKPEPKNCENGMIYTNKVHEYGGNHVTRVWYANFTSAWEYTEDSKYKTKCGSRGPSAEVQRLHDMIVREQLDRMVGPPPNLCNNKDKGGCEQICTNNRGEAECSCTADHTIDKRGKCLAGLALQAKANDRCVKPNLKLSGNCARDISDEPQLFTYEAGQLKATNLEADNSADPKCLTSTENTQTASEVSLSDCNATLASQKWECLSDGRIQQTGTNDLFLRNDMKQCNTTNTPDDCKADSLKWTAFDRENRTFCAAYSSGSQLSGSNLVAPSFLVLALVGALSVRWM